MQINLTTLDLVSWDENTTCMELASQFHVNSLGCPPLGELTATVSACCCSESSFAAIGSWEVGQCSFKADGSAEVCLPGLRWERPQAAAGHKGI